MAEGEHRHITWDPDNEEDVLRAGIDIKNARAAGFYIIEEGPGQVLATLANTEEVPATEEDLKEALGSIVEDAGIELAKDEEMEPTKEELDGTDPGYHQDKTSGDKPA